jgi:hypothetical protein
MSSVFAPAQHAAPNLKLRRFRFHVSSFMLKTSDPSGAGGDDLKPET